MKKIIGVLVSVLLVITIFFSIGWYLLEYDPDFTRDFLLQSAQQFEHNGRNSIAIWLYNLAYNQGDQDENVAIELADYYKSVGNYTKAEYTLSKAIEDGGGIELYIALCKTFVEQDKLRDAVTMLDKVSDPEIRAQLDSLRPAAPTSSYNSGHYSQYITVDLSADSTQIYASFTGNYPSVATDLVTEGRTLSGSETTVYAVAIGDNGLVSPLAEFHYTISNVVEEVFFADKATEAAVREYLNLSESEVVISSQLWHIYEFRIPDAATTCQDLKWMPNLTSLTIRNCAFDNLQVLSELTKLKTLNITDSVISAKDLQVIGALPALEKLTLSGCYLSSVSALAEATNLTYLDLSNNSIRDLTGLSTLSKLEYLDLSENALVDLNAISSLTLLKTLDVSYNSLVTTAPVATLTNLTQLDVSGNGLFKLEGMETLTELTWFAASENHLIDVSILGSCTKLQTLIISNNTILSIQVLSVHENLKYLDFSYNDVSSLPAFHENCPLQIINGGYNQLSSLDQLSVLQQLEFVYMDYNENIKRVDKLTNCQALKIVNVYGTAVRNVSMLTELGIIVNYTPA